ncbi:MAG: hypothetical protein JSS87_12785 [Acidobacteria bacterium]|nr:hypothetical protein [Acidobacteriota bacterium]
MKRLVKFKLYRRCDLCEEPLRHVWVTDALGGEYCFDCANCIVHPLPDSGTTKLSPPKAESGAN